MFDSFFQVTGRSWIIGLGILIGTLFVCLFLYGQHSDTINNFFKNKTLRRKQIKNDCWGILQDIPIWLTISTCDNNALQTCNDAFTEATGLTSFEVAGRAFAEAGFSPHALELHEGLRKIKENGSLYDFRMDYINRNGEIRNALWSAKQIEISGKAYIVSVVKDITQYQIAADALRNAQESMYDLVEKNNDGILILDMQGKIKFANVSATQILGRSKEELHGHSFGLPISTEQVTEVDIIRKGGKPGIGELHETLTVWEGELAHLVSIRDVTRFRIQERQLRQSQKLEAVGTLAGGIAHDFNNILSIIMGNCELALMELPEESPISQYLQNTLKVSKWGADLVGQILSFSRQREVEKIPLDLATIVKESLNLLRSGMPTNIEIVQNLSPLRHKVLADPAQIQQIVMNLCNNAAQAIGPTSGVIDVTLEEVVADDGLPLISASNITGFCQRLSVRDSGCGMTQAAIDRIFEPFYTTKESTKGTGLGLSVVHGIVQNHGGAISVSSKPGEGSTFAIYFPVLREED